MTASHSRNFSFNTKILIVLILLITYGSLYPGNFTNTDPDALERFFTDLRWMTSLGDTLGNIALFLPLGVAGGWTIHTQKKNFRLLLLLVASFIFSLILQILQIWLPTRSAALADVLWNMTGLSLGIGASFLVRRLLSPWSDKLSFFNTRTIIPVTILFLWLCTELLPLVPALDWQKFKDAIKPLQAFDFSFPHTWMHAAGILTVGSILSLVTQKPLTWLTGALLFVLAGKIIIVDQVLNLSTILGLPTGYLVSVFLLQFYPRTLAVTAFWSLLSAWTIYALTPFSLMIGGTFNPIPFATMLEGSMLTNAMALAQSLYIYSALLWLVPYIGGNLRGITIALLIWSIFIELIQMGLLGRTADITEPLLIGLIAWGLSESKRLKHHTEIFPSPSDPASDKFVTSIHKSHRLDPGAELPSFNTWVPLISLTVGATGLLWLILRLPKVPYNLKELFLFEGNALFIFIFILALLWIGVSAAWISSKVLSSSKPLLSLPRWVFVVSLISLGLLSSSVTQESIADIVGSNNLYWFVVNKDIWGESWHHIFEWLGPTFISTLERLVRYAALYAPLAIFLVLIICFFSLYARRELTVKNGFILIAGALPWLWLAKAIAFDWSSTDNLNELIARDSALGMGGGFYVYILLLVLCTNAVILANISGYSIQWIFGALLSLTLLPVGWWLLSLGLEPQVEKYGNVFSGAQFLLGPDRKQILPEMELFKRWCLVQTGFVIIISTGIRSYHRLSQQHIQPRTPNQRQSVS